MHLRRRKDTSWPAKTIPSAHVTFADRTSFSRKWTIKAPYEELIRFGHPIPTAVKKHRFKLLENIGHECALLVIKLR